MQRTCSHSSTLSLSASPNHLLTYFLWNACEHPQQLPSAAAPRNCSVRQRPVHRGITAKGREKGVPFVALSPRSSTRRPASPSYLLQPSRRGTGGRSARPLHFRRCRRHPRRLPRRGTSPALGWSGRARPRRPRWPHRWLRAAAAAAVRLRRWLGWLRRRPARTAGPPRRLGVRLRWGLVERATLGAQRAAGVRPCCWRVRRRVALQRPRRCRSSRRPQAARAAPAVATAPRCCCCCCCCPAALYGLGFACRAVVGSRRPAVA